MKGHSDNTMFDGLTVCIIAPAPALLAGLSTILRSFEIVDTVYTAESLDEFEQFRQVTDILFVFPGHEASIDFEQVLGNAPIAGVVILVADGNDGSWLLPVEPEIAWGVLPLTATLEQFESALLAIAAGLSVGIPAMVSIMKDNILPEQEELIDHLTDREIEVLQLLARGNSNKQIALDLLISEHTVKFHVSSIYSKLGASNRTEAVRLGVRRGLITL